MLTREQCRQSCLSLEQQAMNPLLRALFANARIPTIKLDKRDYYAAMDALYARF